jgi:hypothetical protein
MKRAAGSEIGREDFRVPAAAGPKFNDGVAGFYAKEGQRLSRMAIFVAGDIGGGSRWGGDGRIQRGSLLPGGLLSC